MHGKRFLAKMNLMNRKDEISRQKGGLGNEKDGWREITLDWDFGIIARVMIAPLLIVVR